MPKQKQKTQIVHKPVLLKEVLDCLSPRTGQSYLDLTAGYGGHATAALIATQAPDKAVLVDRDTEAIRYLKSRFSGSEVVKSDFLSRLEGLADSRRKFDMVLADLGVSSPHLETAERGFSLTKPGPLDMRMDQSQELTADSLVNDSDESDLADILKRYGEEPRAKTIAAAIVAARPVKDTVQLATIIAQASGWQARKKIHPATRSFQALRIAVNDELKQLEQALPLMVDVLAPNGRLAIISFHSLEDRIIKRFLAERSGVRYDAELTLLTKKPITAGRDEIVSNPRARSAKLRAAAKIKTKIERIKE